jgi:hypothetical protein
VRVTALGIHDLIHTFLQVVMRIRIHCSLHHSFGQVWSGLCRQVIVWGFGVVVMPIMALAQSTPPSVGDTLEIRSGASSVPIPPKKTTVEPQQTPRADTSVSSQQASKPITPEQILQITLEELLELPMETVLEYAKILDSLQAAQQPNQKHSRSQKKNIRSVKHATSRTQAPSTLDKLNAALQQIQAKKSDSKHSSGASPKRLNREEILRMKLKDLMDMRLGEILRLVNPVLASSATSSARPK